MSGKSNYRLDLEHFCENCPNFDVNVEQTHIESGDYGQKDRYYYILSCKMLETCRNIYDRILKEEREKRND